MSKEDALAAAHTAAKRDGYAFAVKWPSGLWSVEARKPSLRMPGMIIIECEAGRELIA